MSTAEAPLMEGVWSAQDTTPAEIEGALRGLLKERFAHDDSFVPARVLNLVAIVDREWRGEIENRLANVGRFHPSRTIVCAVEPRRTTLSAVATTASDVDAHAQTTGSFALAHEHVVIELGSEHLAHLDTIVDPLLVSDLATVVWSPHGHHQGVDALTDLAQVILVDSVDEPDIRAALRRAAELAHKAYVVDLAWLRSTPWRERIAATFDPPRLRSELRSIASVTVRHRPDSAAAGLLLLGWLASRLDWKPSSMIGWGSELTGRARAPRRQDVILKLEAVAEQSVPGLAGITIETASGIVMSLDRGPGGLHACRRARDGSESRWTLLGASRGEAGVLGEGIRQSMLRDPTYRGALAAAEAMIA
jgi:glucose-6-phosphate dehydrogenase assembly protein OpcA